MNYWDRKLIREQLDTKLERLKEFTALTPGAGWVKLTRDALGMTTEQLAKRVGTHQSRISRIENAEMDGDAKLSTLRKIAEALNMQFVYAFVPNESFEKIVRNQAKKIAQTQITKVSHTMKLEDQELSETEKKEVLENLIQKILIEEPKDFWDQ